MTLSRSRRRHSGSPARPVHTSVGANVAMLVASLAAIAVVSCGIGWVVAAAALAFTDWISK